ncbi:hypothetical protein [Actinomycetospora corticicola]|uniref:Uncharacterized protein n=1 Tax=Actinomycetospora corticicola TaxID=663602 RepID=A0A7Y9DXF2_9PSEU|nr:hypothetical protein [Actinomycetospora corticicola]NYD37308.1 hypothetical protein [Actinomycetospora corticicola]
MSAPERPDLPDLDVLSRVLDGLRSLPEQTRRRAEGTPGRPVDDGPSDATAVPLPRRR